MSSPVIRGKVFERYITLLVLTVLLLGSFLGWRCYKAGNVAPVGENHGVVEQPNMDKEPHEPRGSVDRTQPLPEQQVAAEEILALPEAKDGQSNEGYIPVPPDDTVPEGSAVRLDMSTGEKTYKPPKVIDDVHDHRDYVDMAALRELHEKMRSVPQEPKKWRQQYEGVRKQVEDLMIELSPSLSGAQALKNIEKLEDCVIASMSNAIGIFNSKYFINLVNVLKHPQKEVRVAAASFMFYSIQNNHVPSEAFLMNIGAIQMIAETFDKETDPSVLYKCISIIDGALGVSAESERFKVFAANLKQENIFQKMTDALIRALNSSEGLNNAAPEKVITALALVTQMTEDESCLHLLEQAITAARSLPRSIVGKIISPICPLTHSRRYQTLHNICRSL